MAEPLPEYESDKWPPLTEESRGDLAYYFYSAFNKANRQNAGVEWKSDGLSALVRIEPDEAGFELLHARYDRHGDGAGAIYLMSHARIGVIQDFLPDDFEVSLGRRDDYPQMIADVMSRQMERAHQAHAALSPEEFQLHLVRPVTETEGKMLIVTFKDGHVERYGDVELRS